MARHNIYIRKENEEAWQKSTKSEWVNDQLSNKPRLKHLNKQLKRLETKMADDIVGQPLPKISIIKTPEQAAEAVKTIIPGKMRWCKVGHVIPSGRDKCLGKGCKFS